MAPVYLNPPVISPFTLVKLKEEQHDPQLFLSPQQAADHPTFFNTATTQYQGVVTKLEESKPYDPMVNKFLDHDGSNDREASSSSSVQSAVDIHSTAGGHNLSFSRKDQDVDYDDNANNNNNISSSSVKWMSSKMRLMKKMMSSNCSAGSADNKLPANYKFQYPLMHDNEINNSIRVCSDCNTTTTPLWRTGPRGPKSLCNACGIRQRKARRAMEAAAAANGASVATDATWVKIKAHNNKEKKSRLTHIAQYKKLHQFKVTSDYNPPPPRHHHQNQTKLCLKEFALNLSKNSASQRVFPQDVEDAAILLMELSCGLSYS